MGTACAARPAGALLPLLLLLACSPVMPLVAGEPTRCSACRAVAEELIARLDAEQPRNHIDLQHRVGPDGKRWGKVIEYKISELRVIHLLEDLCDGMDSYEMASDAAGERWARSDSLDGGSGLTSAKPRKEQRRQLSNFCHDVIEKHEDELSLALRNGEVSSDNASDFLCMKAAGLCQQTWAEEQAAAAAARSAAEEAARAAAEKEAAEAAKREKEAAAAAEAETEGQQAGGGQGSGAEAQQPAAEPEAGGAAAAAAGGDAMQEARSEL